MAMRFCYMLPNQENFISLRLADENENRATSAT